MAVNQEGCSYLMKLNTIESKVLPLLIASTPATKLGGSNK